MKADWAKEREEFKVSMISLIESSLNSVLGYHHKMHTYHPVTEQMPTHPHPHLQAQAQFLLQNMPTAHQSQSYMFQNIPNQSQNIPNQSQLPQRM